MALDDFDGGLFLGSTKDEFLHLQNSYNILGPLKQKLKDAPLLAQGMADAIANGKASPLMNYLRDAIPTAAHLAAEAKRKKLGDGLLGDLRWLSMPDADTRQIATKSRHKTL